MIEIKDLSFRYSLCREYTLDNINLKINKGDYLLITGPSGSSKTTLLKLLKPGLVSQGEKKGEILYCKEDIDKLDREKSVREIGYLSQDIEEQIITDKVSNELAFALESLSRPPEEIKRRIAEVSEYLNISDIYNKKTNEISSGQKQLVNLASLIALRPKVLLLDEPLSQLDQSGCEVFLNIIDKLNRDLSMTIVIVEQRVEDIFYKSNRIIYMESGKILCDSKEQEIDKYLYKNNKQMFLPAKSLITQAFNLKGDISKQPQLKNTLKADEMNKEKIKNKNEDIIKMKECSFRYKNEDEDIIKDCTTYIKSNAITAILGSNGAGKSTMLKLLSTLLKPYRGNIKYKRGIKISIMPQEVKGIIIKDSVEEELSFLKEDKIDKILDKFSLTKYKKTHPYDLSIGEMQRLALIKVLYNNCDVVMLDEPTRGLDNIQKNNLGELLIKLKNRGKTIIMVSHDLDFCAEYADFCGLLFNKNIITMEDRDSFFKNNYFYTTQTQKINKEIISRKDVLKCLG